ncbi:MAG: hypothetical protein ACE5GA_00120 [Candidatus Zixiibacteriota bacterium]
MKHKPFQPGYQLVEIEWMDSHHINGWSRAAEAERDCSNLGICRSIAWLIGESKDMITLSAHIAFTDEGEVGAVNSPMTIPKVAIRSRHKIVIK